MDCPVDHTCTVTPTYPPDNAPGEVLMILAAICVLAAIVALTYTYWLDHRTPNEAER